MLKIIRARFRQGHRTLAYPRETPKLSERYLGRPQLAPSKCGKNCKRCMEKCPAAAIQAGDGKLSLDLGRCLFCGDCQAACPSKAIQFTRDHRMAVRARQDLRLNGAEYALAKALDEKARRLFGRSFKLRQVSAGGCGACEADINVLGTLVFDLGRFGIQIVASPRHADALIITGPVTQNMVLALRKTHEAVPPPRLVIAVGACAISGGLYADHPETTNGVETHLPVDLYIPGCPPHPLTILDGLLRLLGRLERP
ncbi:MAG: NADH-quinone oxidoreductase subunit NuoB [Verrucomicrobiae bacterium]|nr:NADH-quinone oxidoreductase subunit NuoB [Verrucomicrobiae bacterium]